MSSVMEMILGQLGSGGLKQLSQQLGTDEKTAGAASGAAISTLLGALAKNSSNDQGANALAGALSKDHDGSILDNLSGFLGQGDTSPGQNILKHVLGGRQKNVQSNLGRATGLKEDQMGKMLSMLAPVVLGALGKQKRSQGLDASSLAGLLGGERQQLERAQPKGMGALAGLLDTDGDGDVDLGDMVKHGGGLLSKFLGRR